MSTVHPDVRRRFILESLDDVDEAIRALLQWPQTQRKEGVGERIKELRDLRSQLEEELRTLPVPLSPSQAMWEGDLEQCA